MMNEFEQARATRTLIGIFGGLAFAAVLTLETHAGYFFYTYLLIAAAVALWLVSWSLSRRRPGEPPLEDYPYGPMAQSRPSPGSPTPRQS